MNLKNGDEVLSVRGLRKTYGKLTAVNGIDLSVRRGEIFGLLGPNGAGKSTTVECALDLRRRDSGEVSILGLDPTRDRKCLFARVGVQFQETRFQDKLRVGEACETTASLYPKTRPWRELLDRFGLGDKAKATISELSGGERQKLAVCLALVPDPELLFLDELTTGLDPAARRSVWQYLKGLRDEGVTIVLTSHFMDEVEFLCDRIAMLKSGTIALEGTPEALIAANSASGANNLEDVFLMCAEGAEIGVMEVTQ
jgi:ABC-2 type transport system ATP-binding protein